MCVCLLVMEGGEEEGGGVGTLDESEGLGSGGTTLTQ